MVTLPAKERHHPLTSTKLYCLVWTTWPKLLRSFVREGIEPTTYWSNASPILHCATLEIKVTTFETENYLPYHCLAIFRTFQDLASRFPGLRWFSGTFRVLKISIKMQGLSRRGTLHWDTAASKCTLPSVTSQLMRRFDWRPSSVIITRVHTATVCCRGRDTEDEDGDAETRREVVEVTSFITFITSFSPTLRTAAWRLDGLSHPIRCRQNQYKVQSWRRNSGNKGLAWSSQCSPEHNVILNWNKIVAWSQLSLAN